MNVSDQKNLKKEIIHPNKILCLKNTENGLYAGDSTGNLIRIFTDKAHDYIYDMKAPISAICHINEQTFCGSWKGDVICIENQKRVNLGNGIIKGIERFENKLIVGIDKTIQVLDLELNVLESHKTKYKVQCMCNDSSKRILFGFSLGCLGFYDNEFHYLSETGHSKNILSISVFDGMILTGSTDGFFRKMVAENLQKSNDFCKSVQIIHEGNGWIRSIGSDKLFSNDHDVIFNNEILYSHDDQVTGIVQLSNMILSVGLDGKIIIVNKN